MSISKIIFLRRTLNNFIVNRPTLVHVQKLSTASNLDSKALTGKKFKAVKNDDHFFISDEINGDQFEASFAWLRDHCRSERMYNTRTHQRAKDILDIPIHSIPTHYEATGDSFFVQWNDGHKSTYSFRMLAKLLPSKRRSDVNSRRVEKVLWDANNRPGEAESTISFHDLASVKGIRDALKTILKFGFCLINDSPPSTIDGTQAAVEKITKISKIGPWTEETWELTSNLNENFSDTAFTTLSLGPHTDGSYMLHAPGLQVFHCLQEARHGGENILVDGFNVAQKFKEKSPEGYRFFSETPFSCEYIHTITTPNEHYYSSDPIFKHDPLDKNELIQFRYNVYDRAPHQFDLDTQRKFYTYLPELAKEIRDVSNGYNLKLSPGTILIVDNWRVMHARNGFNGRRIMSGCYVARDDFMSAAKSMSL